MAQPPGSARGRWCGVASPQRRMELKGRAALVTGAGHRVGRAIALALGARGMRVAVHYNAAEAGAQETLAQIRAAGGDGATVEADLTQAEAAGALITSVAKTFG